MDDEENGKVRTAAATLNIKASIINIRGSGGGKACGRAERGLQLEKLMRQYLLDILWAKFKKVIHSALWRPVG